MINEFKIKPNLTTFSSMINGYCKLKQMKKRKIYLKNKIKPDVITFNTLINGYFKSGNLENELKHLTQ